MHLRPDKLETLLGVGPVAVPDTLEGGGGSLRHSRRRVRLSKAFQEGAAAQGIPEEGGREVLKNLALEALKNLCLEALR